MDTERRLVPHIRTDLSAACPAIREGGPADAVAGVVPALVASPASTGDRKSVV